MFKLNCCIQATGMASSHKGNPMNRTKKICVLGNGVEVMNTSLITLIIISLLGKLDHDKIDESIITDRFSNVPNLFFFQISP